MERGEPASRYCRRPAVFSENMLRWGAHSSADERLDRGQAIRAATPAEQDGQPT